MKKTPFAAPIAALLLLTLPLSACVQSPASTDSTDTAEVVTIPPVTIPAEPDDRKPTDLAFYSNHLQTLFGEATPSAAEDFTYEASEEGTVTITGYVGGVSAETSEPSAEAGDADEKLVVVIPDTIDGMAVTAIAEGAFADQAAIDDLFIPDSVTSIGFGAFEGCKGLTSMRTPVYTCEGAPYFGALFGAETHDANGYTVPTSLTTLVLTKGESIPDCAFYACRNLKVVGLPAELTELGDFAFYNCQSLAYIAAGKTALRTIGQNAFTNCANLLALDIPATAEILGFAMLEGCGALEALTLPFVGGSRTEADTAYLGYLFGAADYTFTAGFLPSSLLTVTLREGCENVPANAFFECASVREILLPEGVTSIGRRAFYGCEKLVDIALPDSVKSIGDDCFHGCLRLAAFTGGANLTDLGVQTFMDCVSLSTVTLPDTVIHLPNAAFAGCISLKSLTADGVKTQGKQVFRHCDLLIGSKWVDATCVPAN